MKHLLVSREYPPCTYPRGGIGTYVEQIARLLAARGETVHVVAELWDGAPLEREVLHDGRLIVHRVPLGAPMKGPTAGEDSARAARALDAMAESEFPAQAFAWQAGLLVESLVESEGIDIIEGQDYEAPLYYLLLRRALGLGPARRPACFVHLHSPWELVCHANGWGLASAYDVTIKRLEDYAIGAADALLCPSEFLASQAERHYGVPAGLGERLPYPIGATPFIERDDDTWENGTLCYVGRLEARKGVLEWVSAAVEVAARRPGLRFEFIGADTSLTGERDSSMRRALEARIPRALASSFAFIDALPREALIARLAGARLAVVPSRWENFPNTCVEAMCSGLPVLVSPHGGMAEMVEDGRTGWLAASGGPADLAAALRRALDVSPSERASMGRAASASIRRRCDNDTTLDRQLAFRRRVAESGAHRSVRLPSMPAWMATDILVRVPTESTECGAVEAEAIHPPDQGKAAGLALVVVDQGWGDLDACLASIALQTRPPKAVVVVTSDSARGVDIERQQPGWQFLRGPAFALAAARDLGLRQAVARDDEAPLAVAMIDPGCRLDERYVATCLSVFEQHPNVGLVSAWSEEHGDAMHGTRLRPQPALPYQWIMNDVSPCSAVRTTAVVQQAWMRDLDGGMPAFDEMAVAVLAEGWRAVTCPLALSSRAEGAPAESTALERFSRARLRSLIMKRFAARLTVDAPLLLHLAQADAVSGDGAGASLPRQIGRGALSLRTVLRLPVAEQLALMRRAFRSPGYAVAWLQRHASRRLGQS